MKINQFLALITSVKVRPGGRDDSTLECCVVVKYIDGPDKGFSQNKSYRMTNESDMVDLEWLVLGTKARDFETLVGKVVHVTRKDAVITEIDPIDGLY